MALPVFSPPPLRQVASQRRPGLVFSIEYVHLAVRLRHHLRGLGSTPLAASRGLFLNRGLHERGAAGSGEVS